MSVRCSHILVKHVGSRNPVSRRTNETITRSESEARAILEGLHVTPQNFAEIAKEKSDCSSFRNGGDLGVFGRGAMQKPFEDASFALAVGSISGIVSTDSGLHIIMRTA
jgi:NIMA-interacting peptidyl-prolyl cis-trans isomerase 1